MKGAFNVDNTKELTHISLCAGYGGIDIGLKRVIGDVRTIAFSEIEAYAVANLVSKMEKGFLDAAPIWTNLKTFPWRQFCGKVDILSGGFPCQPFSSAGRRNGTEDPRHLWPYIVRGIRELGRPPIVFFENVEGIISSKLKSNEWSDPIGTSVLQHVLRELERLGYRSTAGLFSASETGAPHQRKRVFILGLKLGNSQHFGLIANKIKRSFDQASNNNSKGEIKSGKLKRYFSRSFKSAYPLPRTRQQYKWEAPRTISKLLYSDIRNVQDLINGKKCNIKKIKRRKTRLYINASFENKLGNPNIKRLQRILFKKESSNKTKTFIARSSPSRNISRIFESTMGRAAYGFACRLDSSKCFTSCDNRTDELRLLGNGVVPDTASKAFTTLFYKLVNTQNK